MRSSGAATATSAASTARSSHARRGAAAGAGRVQGAGSRILPECYAKRIERIGPQAIAVLCELGEEGGTSPRRAPGRASSSPPVRSPRACPPAQRDPAWFAGKGLGIQHRHAADPHFDERLELLRRPADLALPPPTRERRTTDRDLVQPACDAVALQCPGGARTTAGHATTTTQMACAGVVVGTESNGTVRRGLREQLGFEAPPGGPQDLIERRQAALAEIFFRGRGDEGDALDAPATRSFKPGDDLTRWTTT